MTRFKPSLGSFVLGAFFIFSATLTGCAQPNFILVESSVINTTKNANFAEVTSTPRYAKMFSQIKSVALNAPSSCANQSTSTATGQAESRGSIVKTYCGVEMAEIEKALVRQGFTVYSWSMMNDALVDKRNNETAIEVARRLGAQVLFQVNSLERIKVNPGEDSRIERRFFASNDKGEKFNPLELDQYRIDKIYEVIGADENRQRSSAKRLGAMLDISAVDAETGQTIWFYRWFSNEESSKNIFATYVLRCWNNVSCSDAREEMQRGRQYSSTEKRSAEVESFKNNGNPASEEDVKYFGLLQKVTTDFGKRFSSGQ